MTETSFYADKIDILGDGRIVIYKRSDATKKGIWQARVRVPGATGYSTRSTKETHREIAGAKAREFYDDALVNVKLGLRSQSGSFQDIYLQWHRSTEGKKSDKRRADQLSEAKRYFFPFFAAIGKRFSQIQESDVEGYWAFRREFWTKGEGAKLKKADQKRIAKGANAKRRRTGKSALSARGNVVAVPSQKSCDMTAGHLKELWRWAVRNGHAVRVLEVDSKGQGRNSKKSGKQYGAAESRRGWFSDAEYKELTTFLRSWTKGKSEGDDLSKLTKRHLYGRRLLRDLFLFMCNSGLRTGEAKQLCWKNVKLDHQMADGTVADLLQLTEGKTGARTVVIRDEAGKVLRRRLGETEMTSDDNFVFCSIDGTMHPDVQKVFKGLLERLGMLEDELGQKRTLYSCRHQYATFRLRYGVREGMSIDELAQNMGTSVAYVQKHYSHKTVEDAAARLVGRRHSSVGGVRAMD